MRLFPARVTHGPPRRGHRRCPRPPSPAALAYFRHDPGVGRAEAGRRARDAQILHDGSCLIIPAADAPRAPIARSAVRGGSTF
ncbi:hypothetical protein EVAR_80533_1 [Eumeta japonica]|uniref:Uncharacterized protein n=1 Tax=Eumeta variegata TaxID=151549 RepID=A0A4C1TMP3_EUMVA|nr:hypothetical protein EVAR_80533_1 [Eumeta japonica]